MSYANTTKAYLFDCNESIFIGMETNARRQSKSRFERDAESNEWINKRQSHPITIAINQSMNEICQILFTLLFNVGCDNLFVTLTEHVIGNKIQKETMEDF